MVTLDLHDILTIDPSSNGLSVGGPFADRRARSTSRNLVSRALRLVGRRAGMSRSTSAIPHGGGLGGGSADAAAVLRWGGRHRPRQRRPRSAPTSRSASSAAAPGCAGSARSSSRSPTSTAPSPSWCRRSPSAPRRSTGRGTSSAGRPRRARTTSSRRRIAVVPELARWRDRIGELSGRATDPRRQWRHVVRPRAAQQRPRRAERRGRDGDVGTHAASDRDPELRTRTPPATGSGADYLRR